jgi:transposase
MIVLEPHGRSSKEVPVSIVGGLDVHRRQITFDWVGRATGQAQRGQITPATREGWAGGWRSCQTITGVRGGGVHGLAVRGRGAAGRRVPGAPGRAGRDRGPGWPQAAGHDRPDRRPAAAGAAGTRSPAQAWIPPAHLLELRVLVRLPKTLVDRRTAWQQRLHAVLFHHGPPCPDHALLTQATRGWLEQLALPQASRLQVTTALRQLDLELDPLERWLRAFARRQPGCRALIDRHDGIGMPIAPTILAELGDARRFGNGDAVVRHTGLDVTVPSSDHKPSPGHLSRQGPQVLGWALFEAAHRIRPPDLPRPRPLHPAQDPGGWQPGRPHGGPQARPPGPSHLIGWATPPSPRSRTCPAHAGGRLTATPADACPPQPRCAAAHARPAPAATVLPPAASKDCVAAHARSPIQHLVAGSARERVRAPR